MGDNKWHLPSTPLSKASENGEIKLVKFLLENGADPNYMYSGFGCPALQTALIFDEFDIAEELLKYGADPDLRFTNEIRLSEKNSLKTSITLIQACIPKGYKGKEKTASTYSKFRFNQVKPR